MKKYLILLFIFELVLAILVGFFAMSQRQTLVNRADELTGITVTPSLTPAVPELRVCLTELTFCRWFAPPGLKNKFKVTVNGTVQITPSFDNSDGPVKELFACPTKQPENFPPVKNLLAHPDYKCYQFAYPHVKGGANNCLIDLYVNQNLKCSGNTDSCSVISPVITIEPPIDTIVPSPRPTSTPTSTPSPTVTPTRVPTPSPSPTSIPASTVTPILSLTPTPNVPLYCPQIEVKTICQ